MRRLVKLWRLPLREKLIFAEAAFLLALCCMALRFIPYRRLMRHLPVASDRPAPPTVDRAVATAMRRASALFGEDLCLRQAVAAYVMLARRGYAASIRVGVRQGADGAAQAHAWLTSGNFVVTGGTGDGLRGFVQLEPVGPGVP